MVVSPFGECDADTGEVTATATLALRGGRLGGSQAAESVKFGALQLEGGYNAFLSWRDRAQHA